MFYNHSTDNLVEVHLQFECKWEVPAVGANGLLVFRTAYPAGDLSVIDFKVLVPSEVVKTKDAPRRIICIPVRSLLVLNLYPWTTQISGLLIQTTNMVMTAFS